MTAVLFYYFQMIFASLLDCELVLQDIWQYRWLLFRFTKILRLAFYILRVVVLSNLRHGEIASTDHLTLLILDLVLDL